MFNGPCPVSLCFMTSHSFSGREISITWHDFQVQMACMMRDVTISQTRSSRPTAAKASCFVSQRNNSSCLYHMQTGCSPEETAGLSRNACVISLCVSELFSPRSSMFTRRESWPSPALSLVYWCFLLLGRVILILTLTPLRISVESYFPDIVYTIGCLSIPLTICLSKMKFFPKEHFQNCETGSKISMTP